LATAGSRSDATDLHPAVSGVLGSVVGGCAGALSECKPTFRTSPEVPARASTRATIPTGSRECRYVPRVFSLRLPGRNCQPPCFSSPNVAPKLTVVPRRYHPHVDTMGGDSLTFSRTTFIPRNRGQGLGCASRRPVNPGGCWAGWRTSRGNCTVVPVSHPCPEGSLDRAECLTCLRACWVFAPGATGEVAHEKTM